MANNGRKLPKKLFQNVEFGEKIPSMRKFNICKLLFKKSELKESFLIHIVDYMQNKINLIINLNILRHKILHILTIPIMKKSIYQTLNIYLQCSSQKETICNQFYFNLIECYLNRKKLSKFTSYFNKKKII